MPVPMNQILLGDCCEVLRTLPDASVDFMLTDPPYLVGYRDRSGRSLAGDTDPQWLCPAFEQMFRVLKRDRLCVSFYGWSRVDLFFDAWKAAGFRVVGHLTFPKRYASSSRLVRYQHENAYLFAKGRPVTPEQPIGDVIEWAYSGNKFHPTQKPLSVLTPLIESFCPLGGLVVDPFAGSGSTCIAARMVGRNAIGIEVDPPVQAVATRRMVALTERLAAQRREARVPASVPSHWSASLAAA